MPAPPGLLGDATAVGPGRLRYEIVDVFTDRPFAGNPLAVVYGGQSLTTEQFAAIALEFNLSETAFPVALTDEDRATGADYRVRIFTPGGEIPFAGHPTLGTAWALRRSGLIEPGTRWQACGAGIIGVHVPADLEAHVELSAQPRDHARILSPPDSRQVASLLGLEGGDIVGDTYAAGCGLSWLYLPVTPEAISRCRASSHKITESSLDLGFLMDPCDGVNAYAVGAADTAVQTDVAQLHVRSRVFVPGYGIAEDAATGSAAAGLGLVLVASGKAAADGQTSYVITQGVEMGRPSRLLARVEAVDGTATLVHVAGQVVPVADGTIAIP